MCGGTDYVLISSRGASVCAVCVRYLSPSVAGFLLQKELDYLQASARKSAWLHLSEVQETMPNLYSLIAW